MELTQQSSQKRVCVFCGGTPVTLEHVWPRWVAAILADGGPVQVERRGLDDEPATWQQVSLEVTVRRVCAVCNNGWLSELEQAAKPLLEPLILGGTQNLTPAELDTVALWCVKTALLFQFTHPERRDAPDDHYPWLYEHRTPPPNTFVWIAGYAGTKWSSWYMHQILGLREPGGHDRGDRGYCATVTAGALVFQVIGIDAIPPVEIEKASENEQDIAQVWPSKGTALKLPPPLMLDDASLPLFADPFGADNIQDLLS
jgi:hypothetical protein